MLTPKNSIAVPRDRGSGRQVLISAVALAITATLAMVLSARAATPIQRVVSPGGIEAWLMETPDSGVISLRMSFEGGALEEPSDKLGVANIVAYLFNEGAGDMPTTEFTRRRQRIVADMAGQASMSDVTITFRAPSIHRDEAFALLAEALHKPRFDTEPFERGKSEAETNIAASLKNPGSIAGNKIEKRLYGTSRYANLVEGTLETLPRITIDDVKAYRGRLFARSNLKVAVAGDMGASELATLLDKLFLTLPEKADVAAKPVPPPQSASAELINMELPQTLVMFANLAPKPTWREGFAYGLANTILSETFTGRLFMEVREKRGLVYTIQTLWSQQDDQTYFIGSFGAGPENVGPALNVTREVLAKFVAEGPTDEEVRRVKDAFIGGYLLNLDTSDALSANMLRMQRLGAPMDLLDRFENEIESITRDEVHAAAKAMIRADLTHTVAIGKPAEGFKIEAQ